MCADQIEVTLKLELSHRGGTIERTLHVRKMEDLPVVIVLEDKPGKLLGVKCSKLTAFLRRGTSSIKKVCPECKHVVTHRTAKYQEHSMRIVRS